MNRHERRQILKEALSISFNTGKLTYALIRGDGFVIGDAYVITQDEQEAFRLVHAQGYRVYAKCKDGKVDF